MCVVYPPLCFLLAWICLLKIKLNWAELKTCPITHRSHFNPPHRLFDFESSLSPVCIHGHHTNHLLSSVKRLRGAWIYGQGVECTVQQVAVEEAELWSHPKSMISHLLIYVQKHSTVTLVQQDDEGAEAPAHPLTAAQSQIFKNIDMDIKYCHWA